VKSPGSGSTRADAGSPENAGTMGYARSRASEESGACGESGGCGAELDVVNSEDARG
jgi:hypothetical protein